MLDAIVIGAGAAGLACAKVLLGEGKTVQVLEARARAGGRIFTVQASNLCVPLELGAEFVHGAPREILDPAREQSIPFYDVTERHSYATKNGDSEFFERVKMLIAKFPARRKDYSVEAVLSQSRAPAETKDMLRSYVEGFHAADLQQMSVNALQMAEDDGEGDLNGSSLFRLSNGYGDFILRHYLSDPLLARAVAYQAPVSRVEHSDEHVKVHYGRGSVAQAKRAVVTVPLGVLHSGAIRFDPEPEGLREAMFSMRMGHVARISFQFRSRFWEHDKKVAPAFFHESAENYFPTWWALTPLRAPVLVAWQGGPKAEEVLYRPVSDRLEIALKTLGKISGRSASALRDELVTYSHHDWSHDPYSRGAYSYVAVSGSARARRLGEFLGRELLFAGEATMEGAARGTVHGAIRSGVRAARKLLRDGP